MQRVKCELDHPPDKDTIKQIEEHDMFEFNHPEEFRPGISEELSGILDDVMKIEEWHASCLAQEAGCFLAESEWFLEHIR
jgi:hypothetical protein